MRLKHPTIKCKISTIKWSGFVAYNLKSQIYFNRCDMGRFPSKYHGFHPWLLDVYAFQAFSRILLWIPVFDSIERTNLSSNSRYFEDLELIIPDTKLFRKRFQFQVFDSNKEKMTYNILHDSLNGRKILNFLPWTDKICSVLSICKRFPFNWKLFYVIKQIFPQTFETAPGIQKHLFSMICMDV